MLMHTRDKVVFIVTPDLKDGASGGHGQSTLFAARTKWYFSQQKN